MSKNGKVSMLIALLGGIIIGLTVSQFSLLLGLPMAFAFGWLCPWMVENWFGIPRE